MDAGDGPGIERRRPFVGAPVELSALTLTVAGTVRAGDATGGIGQLRRARQAGITTFDTVEALDPDLAETLLARAFPEGDRTIVVISRGGSRAREAPRSPRADRARPLFHRLVEVEASELPSDPQRAASAPGTGASSEPGQLVLRCRSADDIDRIARLRQPWVLSGTFSLLDRTVPTVALRSLGSGSFTWIARDPFAGGRLDASRFVAEGMAARFAAPRTVRELEAEFEPVARLGFLARPRQRTLAQAALRYVLDAPWVLTACLPALAPERWSEIVGFGASLPLEDGERQRIDAVTAKVKPPAYVGGGAP